MTSINDQFNQFLNLQAAAFQPARHFYGAAAETFERLLRQNQAVLGDYVDFATQQARLPADAQNINEYASRQVEINRALGQKMVERFQGYLDIARAAQAQATETVAAEVKQAA